MGLRSKMMHYLRRNWGALLIIAFMVLLIFSAAELSYGLALVLSAALLLGVTLQIATYVRHRPVSNAQSPPPRIHWERRKRLLAISITAVVLLSVGAVVYLEHSNVQALNSHQTTVSHQIFPILTANISFAKTIKEPDGTIVRVTLTAQIQAPS